MKKSNDRRVGGCAGHRAPPENCIFCKIIAGEIPCEKVYEDKHTLAFLDAKPVNPGHTLIVPKAHVRNIFDCPPETLNKVMATVQKVAKKYPCVKIVQNNEKPLQEVFHLHFHVIPYPHT